MIKLYKKVELAEKYGVHINTVDYRDKNGKLVKVVVEKYKGHYNIKRWLDKEVSEVINKYLNNK